MTTTQTPTHLDEARIAADAADFARRLTAADTHREDQARARKATRREQQARFDAEGLPRGTWAL